VPITARKARAPGPATEVAAPGGEATSGPYPDPSLPPTRAAPREPSPAAPDGVALRQELAALQVAIESSRREAHRNLWTVGIACALLALGLTAIAQTTAPRPSAEDQRLQRLGAHVEVRWRELSEKERRQLERLLGWNQSTEPRAQ
jgi:hypothetical protein